MRISLFKKPLRPTRADFATKCVAVVLATLIFWAPATSLVYAQDDVPEYEFEGERPSDEYLIEEDPALDQLPEREGVADTEEWTPPTEDDPTHTPIALPSGVEASAATPQAIQLPDAEGSVEGMGESFSPVLSSGTATFSVPIAVAAGRAGVQPSLALSYATTGGNGVVGFGWSIGVPFISRQTDRGLPHYIDQASWHEEEDRFIYNGGQELVPVDRDAIAAIEESAMDSGDTHGVPAELASWQQYRARVEGGFMRFFRSPDSERWVVQSKDGTRFDFGTVADGPTEMISGSSASIERDPESGGIFRWGLTRMSDAHGSTVYYRYSLHDAQSYLETAHYVSPASCAGETPAETRACVEPLDSYAARVRFVYESRPDVFSGYVAGFRIGMGRRLRRIEVTAHNDTLGQRALVRRYHLRYQTSTFHSLLESIQVEGRPETYSGTVGAMVGTTGVPESTLSDAMVGTLLPAMRFAYTEMPTSSTTVPGFGGIDTTVHTVANSPPHSADEARTDLFDVNSDGLVDILVTDPARYRTDEGGPAVGVFFNGFEGRDGAPAGATAHFSDAVPVPMAAEHASVLSLSNANVVPMDIDGDGRSDLLHMPRHTTYGWWAPTRQPDRDAIASVDVIDQQWAFSYAVLELGLDPRIDLGSDRAFIQTLDVNNDHLIDVVRSTGTSLQTWVNLGWLPEGDGRFGSYRWTGSEWALSTEPYESCLPHSGTPLDFDDAETRFADMNGDGLVDIARVRRGRVVYWPGRGDGVFGVGSRHCASGFASNRHIEMSDPPQEVSIELDSVFLEDVNMDGVADVVQVHFDGISVWFNRAGTGFTARVYRSGTPTAPAFQHRLRFADIDGSATSDLIYGDGRDWRYMDLAGGQRPRLLRQVDNGLGALTSIAYGSSAEDYVQDLEEAAACASCERFTWGSVDENDSYDTRLSRLTGDHVWRSAGSPVISTVVRSVTTTDRFDRLGREAQVSESRFAYHDGYYEGIEQEFRGFGAADAIAVGDWNHPTTLSRTHFLQGRRPSYIADDRLADNPDEALKGREVMTEVFDESGVFVSTSFATISNRRMLVGLDGRAIHYAYVSETNELRYDTSPFASAEGASVELAAVVSESLDAEGAVSTPYVEETRHVAIRGEGAARIRTTFDEVDALGHVRTQTAHGQVEVDGATAVDGLIQAHLTPTLINGGEFIWRTARSYTDDGASGPTLGETLNHYNEVGDLLRVTQVVDSASTFTFAGEPSNQTASGGAAVSAVVYTQTHDDMVASSQFDAWGNALLSCAGYDVGDSVVNTANPPTDCFRFGNVSYDASFAQLAVSESIFAQRYMSGMSVIAVILTTTGTWDRGLGAIVSASDPNSFVTSVTYDGLGRLTSVKPPPVAGCESANRPTTRIAYHLTTNPSAQPLSYVVTTTELSCTGTLGADVLESVAYVDGLGRPRAALATGDTAGSWIRSGVTTLDKKGTPRRAYQPSIFASTPTDFTGVVSIPTVPSVSSRYDAFGRAMASIAEDGSTSWSFFHALSTDACDANDVDPSSPHYQTCSTAYVDGHGRAIDQVLRNRDPDSGAAATYRLWSYYRTDGAVLALVRTESSAARPATYTGTLPTPSVLRTFTYDTAGRRIASADPDTNNPADGSAATNRWRYLFNRVGDLVAVRDPRGCGQNFFYDNAGRVAGEQYINCPTHAPDIRNYKAGGGHHSLNHLIGMTYRPGATNSEVTYFYDRKGADSGAPIPSAIYNNPYIKGRLTSVVSRGGWRYFGYDPRGNVTWEARQVYLIQPHPISSTLGTMSDGSGRPYAVEQTPTDGSARHSLDQSHTYIRTASFDHAGRPRAVRLPPDPDYDDTDPAPAIGGVLVYNHRGLPAGVAALDGCTNINPATPSSTWLTALPPSCTSGTVHPIVTNLEYLRDGLVSSISYGEANVLSTTLYDVRRRPYRMRTQRSATSGAAAETLGAVTTVADQELVFDPANNLVDVLDHRLVDEWPAGHRPQSVHIRHDALYRVIGAEFDYTQGDGGHTPLDLGTDWRTEFGQTTSVDPVQQGTAPLAPTLPDDRVASLTWEWDYLANTTHWGDDANSFYERSVGALTNGDTESLRPSALYLATNIGDGTGGGAGWVELDYGVSGNVNFMTVHAQCEDAPSETCADPGGSLSTRKAALRANCACDVEQHYQYRWDELNRLSEARRFDRSGGGSWTLEVRQRHLYDESNQRTVRQTIDSNGERITLYPFPGDFERRGLVIDASGPAPYHYDIATYAPDGVLPTETQYVIGGARTVLRHDGVGQTDYHVGRRFLMPVSDLISTTSAVVDVRTGELIEASTYYPNGGRETFLNNDETLTAPEPNGFTGKEADEDVGLTYFGERWLIPHVGRWATPDPLHVHAVGGGEALNSFHYVSGNLLQARDPLGLYQATEHRDPRGAHGNAGAPPERPAAEIEAAADAGAADGREQARRELNLQARQLDQVFGGLGGPLGVVSPRGPAEELRYRLMGEVAPWLVEDGLTYDDDGAVVVDDVPTPAAYEGDRQYDASREFSRTQALEDDRVERRRGPPIGVVPPLGEPAVRAPRPSTTRNSLTPAVQGTPYHPDAVAERRAAAQAHYLGTTARRAQHRAGELLHEARRSGVGTGAGRSGGHGTPYLRAGAQLEREANALSRDDPMREALRTQARRLRDRGHAINHR